jgi:hypothetical protein
MKHLMRFAAGGGVRLLARLLGSWAGTTERVQKGRACPTDWSMYTYVTFLRGGGSGQSASGFVLRAIAIRKVSSAMALFSWSQRKPRRCSGKSDAINEGEKGMGVGNPHQSDGTAAAVEDEEDAAARRSE